MPEHVAAPGRRKKVIEFVVGWALYAMEQSLHAYQWKLECEGLSQAGLHDDERCLARRERVPIDLPAGDGRADAVLWVDADRLWDHLEDDRWDWRELPGYERACYTATCLPGLISKTPALVTALELVGIEGMAEAYGQLPYPGGLYAQPSGMLEAWGVIRQTRNVLKMREMRQKEMEWRNRSSSDGRQD